MLDFNKDFYFCPPLDLILLLEISYKYIVKIMTLLYDIVKASNNYFRIYQTYYKEKHFNNLIRTFADVV